MDVYFLSLDANRAYPKKNINFNEVAQAYEVDWAGRRIHTWTFVYDDYNAIR